jgi:outer membrane protein assembly factor BamB
VVSGVRIATDWAASPPVEVWRQPVGPGWSSFAVRGDHFFTQEQRGEEEVVTCYEAATGRPAWRHRDPVRFWEANAGAGPRATPTLHEGRVYSFGATGILNVLDADDGALAWSVDAGQDAEVEVPYWGFSGSPLVVDDLVIVAAAGRLVAYDRATGARRWLGPDGGGGYSSPHQVTFDRVAQVLLVSGKGVTGVAADDGATLWELEWPGSAIVQPATTEDGDLLIGTESGLGRVTVSQGADGWTTEERWSTNRLKPYFNDFVVHEGHAYGFDGRALACVDLAEGERQWKGGRYGQGQLVLLADQGLLLVVTEDGDLVLVEAAPGEFTEVARVPAIEGKTWNHPVLVGDVLLARNSQEMAAYRLTLAGS